MQSVLIAVCNISHSYFALLARLSVFLVSISANTSDYCNIPFYSAANASLPKTA